MPKNDFENKETLVTIAKKQLGQRRFEETENFSILIYNGKLVITANEALESWCREILAKNDCRMGFRSTNAHHDQRKIA